MAACRAATWSRCPPGSTNDDALTGCGREAPPVPVGSGPAPYRYAARALLSQECPQIACIACLPAAVLMRVVYFTSLFPCWSETFIVREILALRAMNVDIRIVSLKPPTERLVQSDAATLLDRVIYPPAGWRGAFMALLEALRHPIETLRMVLSIARGLGSAPTSMAKSLVVVLRTLAMLREIRRFAPDHLHAHWATYPSTSALFASRLLGVPFSFTSHAHDIFLEDHLLALKLSEAKFGVTISEFNRRFISERIGSRFADKLRIVHCGISPQSFPFEVAQPSTGRIVAVGRLDEIKGFEHWCAPARCCATRASHSAAASSATARCAPACSS
ncbi:glycosyltransferase [Piscinibacter aquaticus]|uniref:Glycosyltransferase n=1 Tax=Piscinibacter aquaticus TaxID=392597 RepID=A0A5C6U0E7_9BURK|nr:glycosyltransferase [Piscinibacter aquaticus]